MTNKYGLGVESNYFRSFAPDAMAKFQAFVVHKEADKSVRHAVDERDTADLPLGEVLIRVHFSSINYKDCLSCMGNTAVTRHFPHTPGVDAAGMVESSTVAQFEPGQSVIVISTGLGVNMPGGFGQYVSVPAAWVMPLPEGMSLHESMIYGTAGYTSALAIEALRENQILPPSGPIAVSGATGGVGSMAVAMLARLGYQSIAATGKSEASAFLTNIGATRVVARAEVDEDSGRNMLVSSWAGAIDSVGGNTLATLIKKCKDRGAVAAVGNIGSQQLNMTVLPFILRGVRLIGIFAEGTDFAHRQRVWADMAHAWKPPCLESMATTIHLEQLSATVHHILGGSQTGRVVLDLRAT